MYIYRNTDEHTKYFHNLNKVKHIMNVSTRTNVVVGALCSSLIGVVHIQKVNHYLDLFLAHLFTYSNRNKNKTKIKKIITIR